MNNEIKRLINELAGRMSEETVEQSEVKMAQAQLEDGAIIEAESWEAGQSVFIVGEEDERIPLPAGEYKLEEGILVVEEEGVIADFKQEEEKPEEAPEEAPAEEEAEMAEEGEEEEAPAEESPEEEDAPDEMEAMKAAMAELQERMSLLEDALLMKAEETAEESVESEVEMSVEETVEEEVEMASEVPATTPLKHTPEVTELSGEAKESNGLYSTINKWKRK